jgi:hypothetical protein
MSTATDVADVIGGSTGSGKGSVLWAQLPVDSDRQILVRVQRGGILIGERELCYQLERRDHHPLAQADELLDELAEIEARGLLEASCASA